MFDPHYPSYSGIYESKGVDSKNRLWLPTPLLRMHDMRMQQCGIEQRVMYCARACEGNTRYVQIIDTLEGISDNEAYRWLPLFIDPQNRSLIRDENLADELKQELVIAGARSHIRIYTLADWNELHPRYQADFFWAP